MTQEEALAIMIEATNKAFGPMWNEQRDKGLLIQAIGGCTALILGQLVRGGALKPWDLEAFCREYGEDLARVTRCSVEWMEQEEEEAGDAGTV